MKFGVDGKKIFFRVSKSIGVCFLLNKFHCKKNQAVLKIISGVENGFFSFWKSFWNHGIVLVCKCSCCLVLAKYISAKEDEFLFKVNPNLEN